MNDQNNNEFEKYIADEENETESAAPETNSAEVPEADSQTEQAAPEISSGVPVGFTAEPEDDAPRAEDEYRRTSEKRSAWSDAGYVPSGDAAMPRSYRCEPPAEKKPASHKGKKAAAIIAACLACAIVGGIAGYAAPKLFEKPAEDTAAVVETLSRKSDAAAPAATPQLSSAAAVGGKEMSATDIYYNLAVKQTVAITTEITYTNIWGYTTSGAVKGSGFILSEDGYIMTNYHVIEEAVKGGYDIEVLFYDGSEYIADVVGYSDENDVAVLKIEATGLNPVVLGDSDALQVGEAVYAVGNPTGELEFSMTDGMVSAKDRELAIRDGSSYRVLNLFQTTAAINGGNSGGPIYNSRGEVIGIATAGGDSAQVEALFFAIPINDAAKIAKDLVTDGYVRGKAYMGIIKPNALSASYAQYYGIVPGVYFEQVEEGSAAEKAGLKVGDIIVKIGDKEIEDMDDLDDALKSYHAGDTATIQVYRNSTYVDLTITFDEARPRTNEQNNNQQQPQQPQQPSQNGGQRLGGNGDYFDYFYDFFHGNPFG